ncbi:29715_t:CDS:2, partial [Gigaspora margarita]
MNKAETPHHQLRNQVNNAARENVGHQNPTWPNVTSNRREYLMVELLEGVEGYVNEGEHIRNLRKRKKDES